MGLRFIYGRCGSGKTTYCLDEINEKLKEDETSPIIFLVPEQYTFEAEKRLSRHIEKDPYFRARVLSFKTLSNIVFSECGGLTNVHIESGGKVMLMYKVIEDIKDDLKLFHTSSNQPGFINTMSDALSELKQYKVTPERLLETSTEVESDYLKLKLHDISKIYEEFEKKMHEKYIDSQDVLNSLAQKIEKCNYLNNAIIYIDEFTGFTPQQYGVIEKILTKAKEVNITLTSDELLNGRTYNKTDVFSRTKFTEEKLVKLCDNIGVRRNTPINLNKVCINKFENNEELNHLDKYYHAYPYKIYEEETKHVGIKEFNNLYDEVEEIAKDIVNLVRDKNVRYRDITIATRDLNRYANLIEPIFKEYNIPIFIDQKREAKNNPIIVLIISALEMITKRYNYESMFRYLKSGLVGIDYDEISLIENYVLANGIKGQKWLKDRWTYKMSRHLDEETSDYEQEIIEKVNITKDKIMKPILMFHEKLSRRNSVRDICTYIYELLLDINMPNLLEESIERFRENNQIDIANQYSQVWDIVIDVLDQMVEIMGEDTISLDQFTKILTVGLEEYELGLVPPTLDQVIASSVDRMKNLNTKYLYLIGTNDGIFPLTAKDNGLLNDMDRENLKSKGVEVDIDSKTKTFEEQFLVYKALTSTSENLTVTYPIADHEGKTLRPSIIVSRLKKIFSNIKNESYITVLDTNEDSKVLKSITSKSPTFNEMIHAIKVFEDRNEINKIWLDVYKYYSKDEEYSELTNRVIEGIYYTNQVGYVEEEKINELYAKKQFSVSRLEKYAGCPFAYFVQYGLKAKERQEYAFKAPDLGTFLHNILDKFSSELEGDNQTWKTIDRDYIDKKVSIIVDEVISKIPGYILESSARYKYLSFRLKKMLIGAIDIIAEQIKKGSFDPIDYEVRFGINQKYPPIKIELSNGEEINLIGQIDRIDLLEKDDEKYIRIVDYKTGNKDLSLTEIYYGLQLQLLVYLDAILESTNYYENNINPAAILYFKIDDPIIKAKEDMKDEKIQDEILKTLKMKGLVLKDAEIIKEMDNTLDPDNNKTSMVVPATLKKDGTLAKSTTGATEEEFDVLRGYVKSTIKDLCEEMIKGNIMIKPYKRKTQTSCDYCNYSAICQFDSTMKDNKYKIINDKTNDDVINAMRKELE